MYPKIQQRLAEWRSGIGSTAICIMIDFFSKLDDDVDVTATATKLFKDFAFLCETADEPSSEGMFWSPFLIELLGTTHLNDIVGYVDIHQWSTKDLAAGKDMAGVLGLASAAVSPCTVPLRSRHLFALFQKLEHAVKYIMEGTIDVDDVLIAMAEVLKLHVHPA